ncbi:MAG: sodium:dicarboxylate symporter, partial [Phenylobacterium sp.]|nr:sodium:dicarboxylate symporter [Phenylobacterium sp.]
MGFLRHFRVLYVQVLLGVILGVLVGALWPQFGASLKPLGDAFIKLIKMAVAPVIF